MNNTFTIVVSNIKNSRKDIFKALLLIGFLLGMIQFIHAWRDIPYENLVRDPNAIANLPKYIGFISQFGIFLWFASVGICFMGYFLIRGIESVNIKSKYLLYFGIFSLMLGLDDAYMLHEELAHRGLYEEMFFGVYAVMLLVFILKFLKLFFQTHFILLILSGFCLASSIAVDKYDHTLFLLDDSFKVSGIVFWFAYFFRTVYTFCKGVINTEV
jgi:hypothetical protein